MLDVWQGFFKFYLLHFLAAKWIKVDKVVFFYLCYTSKLSITAVLVNIIEKGLTKNTDAMIQYLERLNLVSDRSSKRY